jgi:mannose-6-phosphate isomerase-like protein (cupin superfamily)
MKRTVKGAIVVEPGEGKRVGNVEFLAESADTERFNLSIVTKTPRSRGPEMHTHENEDDSFYVLDGEFVFEIEDERVTAGPGTFVLVPPGVLHTFANESDEPARMLNVHAPAGFDLRIS